MSKKTLEFHYGKHHRAYVDNLNKQIENTDFERNTLEEVVKISYNNGNPLAPFNNAGQVRLSPFYLHFVVQSLQFLSIMLVRCVYLLVCILWFNLFSTFQLQRLCQAPLPYGFYVVTFLACLTVRNYYVG